MVLCNLVQRHQIVAQKWDLTSKINKDLSKETQQHIFTFQSWCAWGCLEGCHSPLINGQLLHVGFWRFFCLFFPGEDRDNAKTNKKGSDFISNKRDHKITEPQIGWGTTVRSSGPTSSLKQGHPRQNGTRFHSDCFYLSPVSWWCCSQDHFRNTFATIPPEHQSAGTAQNIHFLSDKVPYSLSCWMHWDPWKCRMTTHSQRYSVWEYPLTVSPLVMDTSPQSSFISAQWNTSEIRQTLTSTCFCKTVKISDLESWVICGHHCLQTEVPTSKHQPPAGTFISFFALLTQS